MKPQKHEPPTEGKKDYLIIAGSGPSAKGFPHADIATKKMSCPADYQAARYPAWYFKVKNAVKGGDTDKFRYMPTQGFMLYQKVRHGGNKYPYEDIPETFRYLADSKYWDSYFKSFNPRNLNKKPSVGLCAVMMAYERWKPDKIGLIGFDWVLDGHKDWAHDSYTEKKVMESLCEIVDLRK